MEPVAERRAGLIRTSLAEEKGRAQITSAGSARIGAARSRTAHREADTSVVSQCEGVDIVAKNPGCDQKHYDP